MKKELFNDLSSDDSNLLRFPHRFNSAPAIQPVEDVCRVHFDRAGAEVELRSDFFRYTRKYRFEKAFPRQELFCLYPLRLR